MKIEVAVIGSRPYLTSPVILDSPVIFDIYMYKSSNSIVLYASPVTQPCDTACKSRNSTL